MTIIQTASGSEFDFADERTWIFEISTIAAALSKLCRFTGHCKRFYSVAQHSVLCSDLVAPSHRMAALLHDAHEAYLGDVSSPLKRLLPDYRALEQRVATALREVYGVQCGAEVHSADLSMLAAEAHALLDGNTNDWEIFEPEHLRVAAHIVITPWPPERAEREFLARFHVIDQSPAPTLVPPSGDQQQAFIRSLLDPEQFGHSVTAEVRNAARRALGMLTVE